MLFKKKEYKERLAKVKSAMEKKGIDLLVSHDPANMNYLTGYDAWSFYYAQCVLVHVNEDEPICFLRAQDVGGAYIKTYLKDKNIIKKKFQLIDARGKQRFLGLQPEPRVELRSGNISGSINLPFTELINSENKTFKNKDDLTKVFTDKNISLEKEMAFTCGSGVTACILGLANSIISGKKPMIYDGSWAEYGLKE